MSEKPLHRLMDVRENAPVFYKPQEVLWLYTWLNRVAVAVVMMTIISGFVGFPAIYRQFLPPGQAETSWNTGAVIITAIATVFGVLFQSIFGYFTLRALGSILRILMEMEFNARRAN